MVLSRAAKIIHEHMFDKEEIFNGDLSRKKQRDSVPSPLLHLISLILEGGSIRDDNSNSVAVNIDQFIKFKKVKHKRQTSSSTHHSKKNETPLPVKIGFMVHAKARKKSPVEKLAVKGLSISYSRVQEFQDNTTRELCQQYLDEGIVCPKNIEKR